MEAIVALSLFLVAWLLAYCAYASGLSALVLGFTRATMLAVLVRLAVVYSAGAYAHASGECGATSILVDSDSTGAARAVALCALAAASVFYTSALLRTPLPKLQPRATCTMRSAYLAAALDRLGVVSTLAAAVASSELITTPAAELLANFWLAERTQLPMLLVPTVNLIVSGYSYLVTFVSWCVGSTLQLMADTVSPGTNLGFNTGSSALWVGWKGGWEAFVGSLTALHTDVLAPSPLLTSVWIAAHPSCFVAFSLASTAANGVFVTLFVWGLLRTGSVTVLRAKLRRE